MLRRDAKYGGDIRRRARDADAFDAPAVKDDIQRLAAYLARTFAWMEVALTLANDRSSSDAYARSSRRSTPC
jgi:hypothetical protein